MEFNQTGPILTLGNLVGRASWTEICCLYSFLLHRINDIDIHNINHKCMYTGCLKKRSHKERRGFQAAVKADIALTVLHWVVLYYDCTIRLKTHSPDQQTSPKTPLSTGCPKKRGDLCSELVSRCLEASNQKSLEGWPPFNLILHIRTCF